MQQLTKDHMFFYHLKTGQARTSDQSRYSFLLWALATTHCPVPARRLIRIPEDNFIYPIDIYWLGRGA